MTDVENFTASNDAVTCGTGVLGNAPVVVLFQAVSTTIPAVTRCAVEPKKNAVVSVTLGAARVLFARLTCSSFRSNGVSGVCFFASAACYSVHIGLLVCRSKGVVLDARENRKCDTDENNRRPDEAAKEMPLV